jgi:hypothetical protein
MTPGGGHDCCPGCALQFMKLGPQTPAFGQRAAELGAAAPAAPASPPVTPAGTPDRLPSGAVGDKVTYSPDGREATIIALDQSVSPPSVLIRFADGSPDRDTELARLVQRPTKVTFTRLTQYFAS